MSRPTPLIPPPANHVPLGDGRAVRIRNQLGRGSCATVYRGVHEGRFGLQREVAVKVFDVLASDENELVLGQLALATRRAACVRHPNVAAVEDFGMLGPAQPYVVSELVTGRSLARLMAHLARRRERLPLDLALFIGLEVAEGLEGARVATSPDGARLSIAHGELSACDVMLSWHGEVKLTDFGLGMAGHAASGVRASPGLSMRMRALSPEVARGKPGDARSDVFSLGVLLRELLVGPRFPPFVSDAQVVAWARDGLVHQSLFEPQPAPALRAVLTRALEREPMRRYPHAGAVGAELRRAALSMGVGDGRGFLRAAMARAFGEGGAGDDEMTGEHVAPTPRPSGVLDRFARLRGEAPLEGAEDAASLDSGTQLVTDAVLHDDDDDLALDGAS